MNTKMSNLLTAETTNDIFLPATDATNTVKKISIPSIIDLVRKEMGFYKNPLQKCGHCGQWGAVFCECIKCGAPIDPERN